MDPAEESGVPGVDDFLAIKPEMRARALVGAFMQHWAAVETGIDTAIGKALGLTTSQQHILSPNISFVSKANILKAAIGLTNRHADDDEVKKRFTKAVNEIMGAIDARNMMAHYIFTASSATDGVEFLVIKARGELKYPQEDWPVSKFVLLLEQTEQWQSALFELEAWLAPDIQEIEGLAAMLSHYQNHEPPAW